MLQDTKNTLTRLKEKIGELRSILRIEEKRERLGKLEQESSRPDLWSDPSGAQKVLKELKWIDDEIKQWEGLRGKVDDLLSLADASISSGDESIDGELAAEARSIEKEVEVLEVKTFLSGQYDGNDAILSINAGAGGTDAQDWAGILLRMYTRYADSKGYKVEMPEISYGEEAGIKSCTLIVSGQFAYGYLKHEKGVHRLVRLSPFNADAKRHTSFASVEVIPEIEEDIEVKISPADLRIDTFRASGPGGQHVNKTDSAIRITHIPTGIVSQSQSDRSQHANREAAMKILKARLYERLLEEKKERIEELKGKFKEIAWGNQIRSYVFHPYTMVKDHRTSAETSNVQSVIDGDIDMFIEASLKHAKR